MDIIYQDKDILVCVKPAGVLSTDEPGGLPELIRQALGDPNANVRTVHRLDQILCRDGLVAEHILADNSQGICCGSDTGTVDTEIIVFAALINAALHHQMS